LINLRKFTVFCRFFSLSLCGMLASCYWTNFSKYMKTQLFIGYSTFSVSADCTESQNRYQTRRDTPMCFGLGKTSCYDAFTCYDAYGCRIVEKFNTHNLYSIRTFYIQYTHFIFNTHILYSIHTFYIQYTLRIFNKPVLYSIFTEIYSISSQKHSITLF
jgi:hypothetical protein